MPLLTRYIEAPTTTSPPAFRAQVSDGRSTSALQMKLDSVDGVLVDNKKHWIGFAPT